MDSVTPAAVSTNGYGDSYTNAGYSGSDTRHSYQNSTHADESRVYTATFASQNINFDNDIFQGSTANAYFGTVILHLENAIINENVTIYCNATFGGIELYLPNYVNVQVQSSPIFGGVSNRRRFMTSPDAPTVLIVANCMFGGVEIK